MFSGFDLEKLVEIYVVPWSINIALAIVIFLVGRLIAKGLVKVLERVLRNAKVDTMLIEFTGSIAKAVLLFYIYYALGEFLSIPKLAAAVVGFGFSYGAYMADVFRAGVEAIPKEQAEAARSLGMNPRQTLFKIILPQALRTIIPAIGNQTLGMLKDTSLVSVLAISDILRVANEYATKHFNYFETYTYIALTYLMLTLLMSRLVAWLEARARIY